MPIIDLKNVTVRLEDGHRNTGAVNNAAGYPAGAVTILVDTIVGSIPDSVRLKFAGHSTEYFVASATDVGGNTTSMVITPPLTQPLVDNEVITFVGRALQIVVGEGNLTYSEKTPIEYKKDRGKLYETREGDEEPMDISLSMFYEELKAASTATAPTVEDVLKRTGLASAWLSSDTTKPCSPYSLDIVFVHKPPICATFEIERVTLPYFRRESLDHDLKAGTISMTGKSNAKEAIRERLAISP